MKVRAVSRTWLTSLFLIMVRLDVTVVKRECKLFLTTEHRWAQSITVDMTLAWSPFREFKHALVVLISDLHGLSKLSRPDSRWTQRVYQCSRPTLETYFSTGLSAILDFYPSSTRLGFYVYLAWNRPIYLPQISRTWPSHIVCRSGHTIWTIEPVFWEKKRQTHNEISCNCFAECTPGHFQATCVVISICNLISRQLLNRMRCALSRGFRVPDILMDS